MLIKLATNHKKMEYVNTDINNLTISKFNSWQIDLFPIFVYFISFIA